MLEYRGKPTKIDPIHERNCIVDYLSQTWSVPTKDKNLPELVDTILARSIDYGIYWHEQDTKKSVDKFLGICNDTLKELKYNGTKITTEFKPREGIEYVLNFDVQIKQLKSELRPYFGKNISPKKAKSKPCFTGAKIDPPGRPNFPDTLCPTWVKYYKERGHSSLEIVMSAIFAHGEYLGIQVVMDEYGYCGEKLNTKIADEFKAAMKTVSKK